MSQIKKLKGKKLLIVDDEQDVLDQLLEQLDFCKIDTASSFDEAKKLLEAGEYDVAILDIMGVKGFDLLDIANSKKIPCLMFTAHALSEENLLKSAQNGASYYVPKDEIANIQTFIADILEAKEKKKNIWVKAIERLGGFYDKRFGGPDWRVKERDFWEKKLKEQSGL